MRPRTPTWAVTKRRKNPSHPLWSWLDKQDMGLSDYAQELGVSRNTLSSWVSGKASISRTQAKRIAEDSGIKPESWPNLAKEKKA